MTTKVKLFVHGQATSGYNARVDTYHNVKRSSLFYPRANEIAFTTEDGYEVVTNLMYVVETLPDGD